MDAHAPRREDDLSAVEQRLTGWRPGADGLDADAMLFAAGLAAGRRGSGRLLAPVLCGVLAALAAGLGAWGLSERAERRALADRLRSAPTPGAAPAPAVVDVPAPPRESPSAGYLSLRRRMEQDPGGWLDRPPPPGRKAPEPPPPAPPILTVRPPNGLFEH